MSCVSFSWRVVLAALVVAVALSCASAQTFHYSHGWTNGKRSLAQDDLVQDAEEELRPMSLLLPQTHTILRNVRQLESSGPLLLVPARSSSGAKGTAFKVYSVDQPQQRLPESESQS